MCGHYRNSLTSLPRHLLPKKRRSKTSQSGATTRERNGLTSPRSGKNVALVTGVYVSSYYSYTCILVLLCTCPHPTVYVTYCRTGDSYISVLLLLLNMYPHTTIYVSSYYICVLMLCILIHYVSSYCRTGSSQSPVNVKRSYWSGYWGSIWAQRFLQSKRAETGDVVCHLYCHRRMLTYDVC